MRLTLALALATTLAAPATAFADDEAQFYVPVPAGWVVAYEGYGTGAKTIELIPDGETIDNWRNLIVVDVVDRQAADTATAYFAVVMQNTDAACRGASYKILQNELISNGFSVPDPEADTTLFAIRCPWSNVQFTPYQSPDPYGEVSVFYVIRGAEQLFAVKRAWRIASYEGQEPAIDPEELAFETMRTTNVALCDIGSDTNCAPAVAAALKHFTDAGDTIFQTNGSIAP